jgi:hypothetical protein
MKKLILTTAVMMTSLSLFAQGTVSFSNLLAPAGGINNDDAGRLVTAADNVVAALYFAPVGESSFTLVDNSQAAVGQFGDGVVLNLNPLSVPGVAGGTSAQFLVRAWDAAFADYDAAVGGQGLAGESPIWEQATGGGGSPPGPPASTVEFIPSFGVAVVPEPSAIALGLLGAGALLLLRRRK